MKARLMAAQGEADRSCFDIERKRKAFFFEKKKQKTFDR
jgi:hypothetical protein